MIEREYKDKVKTVDIGYHRESCRVHKSELADAIEDIFRYGGYNVKISCVERND